MGNLLQPATYSRASTSLSIFGPGGSGKSLTAILIALGNSIERRNRAGIALVDPEDVSDFLLRACELEGVPLFTMKRRTFVEMRDALAEAEDAGLSLQKWCCNPCRRLRTPRAFYGTWTAEQKHRARISA